MADINKAEIAVRSMTERKPVAPGAHLTPEQQTNRDMGQRIREELAKNQNAEDILKKFAQQENNLGFNAQERFEDRLGSPPGDRVQEYQEAKENLQLAQEIAEKGFANIDRTNQDKILDQVTAKFQANEEVFGGLSEDETREVAKFVLGNKNLQEEIKKVLEQGFGPSEIEAKLVMTRKEFDKAKKDRERKEGERENSSKELAQAKSRQEEFNGQLADASENLTIAGELSNLESSGMKDFEIYDRPIEVAFFEMYGAKARPDQILTSIAAAKAKNAIDPSSLSNEEKEYLSFGQAREKRQRYLQLKSEKEGLPGKIKTLEEEEERLSEELEALKEQETKAEDAFNTTEKEKAAQDVKMIETAKGIITVKAEMQLAQDAQARIEALNQITTREIAAEKDNDKKDILKQIQTTEVKKVVGKQIKVEFDREKVQEYTKYLIENGTDAMIVRLAKDSLVKNEGETDMQFEARKEARAAEIKERIANDPEFASNLRESVKTEILSRGMIVGISNEDATKLVNNPEFGEEMFNELLKKGEKIDKEMGVSEEARKEKVELLKRLKEFSKTKKGKALIFILAFAALGGVGSAASLVSLAS